MYVCPSKPIGRLDSVRLGFPRRRHDDQVASASQFLKRAARQKLSKSVCRSV